MVDDAGVVTRYGAVHLGVATLLVWKVVAPVLPQYARHFGVSISAATFVITAFAVILVGVVLSFVLGSVAPGWPCRARGRR